MGEPFEVVLFLFGQQAIAGPSGADGIDQKAVRRRIPRFAGSARSVSAPASRALAAGCVLRHNFGEMGGQFGVGHGHFSGMICLMMKSRRLPLANVISTVLTRMSGAGGSGS
jgi:hypothetical protein